MTRRARLCGLAVVITLSLAGAATAREWSDETFASKTSASQSFLAVADRDATRAHSIIGSNRFYQVQKHDTFLDIARYYDLGYNEISEANPGVDEWVPPAGQ